MRSQGLFWKSSIGAIKRAIKRDWSNIGALGGPCLAFLGVAEWIPSPTSLPFCESRFRYHTVHRGWRRHLPARCFAIDSARSGTCRSPGRPGQEVSGLSSCAAHTDSHAIEMFSSAKLILHVLSAPSDFTQKFAAIRVIRGRDPVVSNNHRNSGVGDGWAVLDASTCPGASRLPLPCWERFA